jgi:hypothetical protein
VYWGNNGLATAMTSTSGGVANTKDTVENVLINNPASGVWTIEVSAPELNGDTHVATPGEDAAYALVVTGIAGSMNLPVVNESLEAGVLTGGALSDTHLSENDKLTVRPGITFTTSQAPIRYVREVMAPTIPGDIWVSVEANTSSNNIDQRIELWDFVNNEWDEIVVHTDMTSTDGVRTAFIANPAGYFDGSNHIRTRVSYFASGPVAVYPWDTKIDHVRVYFAP